MICCLLYRALHFFFENTAYHGIYVLTYRKRRIHCQGTSLCHFIWKGDGGDLQECGLKLQEYIRYLSDIYFPNSLY